MNMRRQDEDLDQFTQRSPDTDSYTNLERAINLLTGAIAEIGALENIESVYRITGQRIQELVTDSYVSVSFRDEYLNTLRIIGIFGFGSLLDKLIKRFNVDPTKTLYKEKDMTPEELAFYRSGRLQRFKQGVYEIMVRTIPEPACRIAERFLGIKAIYSMGFVVDNLHFGGIVIFSRKEPLPYSSLIEALMNHATVRIKHLRSEEKLRKNEAILKLFVTYAPAEIAMFDMQMRYLAASKRFLKDYRIEEGDMIGHSYYDFFSEVSEQTREIHNRCLAGATESSEAELFRRVDGTTDWVRWQIHPWYENETTIGGIMLMSEVITDRKIASEKINQLNE
jgi:PAS domain S-box-containing protein